MSSGHDTSSSILGTDSTEIDPTADETLPSSHSRTSLCTLSWALTCCLAGWWYRSAKNGHQKKLHSYVFLTRKENLSEGLSLILPGGSKNRVKKEYIWGRGPFSGLGLTSQQNLTIKASFFHGFLSERNLTVWSILFCFTSSPLLHLPPLHPF